MKRMKYKILLPVMLSMLAISCEYIEEPTVDTVDNIYNSWVVQQVFIDGQEDTATDYTAFVLQINNDNTYSLTTESGNTTTGIWRLANQNKLILNEGTPDERVYLIAESNESSLVLLYENEFFKEVKSVFRYVLIPMQ